MRSDPQSTSIGDVEVHISLPYGHPPGETKVPIFPKGRWTNILLVLVVSIIFAAATADQAQHPSSRPGHLTGEIGPPVVQPSSPAYSLLLVNDDDLFTVGLDALDVFSVPKRRMIASVPLDKVDIYDTSWTVVADTARQSLWLIGTGVSPQVVLRYSVRNSSPILTGRTSIPFTTTTAVATQGNLYLGTSAGLGVVNGSDMNASIEISSVNISEVVADPLRSRLLLLSRGQLLTVSMSAGSPIKYTPHYMQATMVALSYVGDEIFAETTEGMGITLNVLNPSTLMASSSRRVSGLSATATIVSAGTNSIWLQDPTRPGRIYCVNKNSDNIAQSWAGVFGAVTIGGGNAYIASELGPRPLILKSCRG